ncbi:MAG: DUF4198 domain-containing protein [Gemmatimonadetes bacterium]|nr:DUF4198 domain-containing protein [Gemmatimonadota bacterium]
MKRFVVTLAGLCLTAGLAAAHDFWLVSVGDELHGISGSRFPASQSAVAPERLVEAVAVSAAGRTPLTVIGARGTVLVLKADPSLGGALWAAVAIKPRRIDLTAAEFNDYIRHDGLPQIYAEREANAELDRPAVERYQKYAKALIVRGGAGSTASTPVGHRFEIVPIADAAALRPGDSLQVEVRFEQHPMPGLTLNAGYDGQADSTHAFTALTDTAGRVQVPVTRAGLWYLRTIHMRRIAEPPFEWESFWASLTFTVR